MSNGSSSEQEALTIRKSISARMLTLYDRIITRFTDIFISRRSVEKAIENERSFAEHMSDIEYYWDAFHTFHARASALISHLSIMIAVSTVALTVASPGIPKILMMFEVISYIFLTLYTIGAMKSLSLETDYGSDRDKYILDLREEVVKKYSLTQVSLSLTVVITVLLMIFSFLSFDVF